MMKAKRGKNPRMDTAISTEKDNYGIASMVRKNGVGGQHTYG